MKSSVYYVYMVTCVDGTIYTGSTSDVSKRIDTHNTGKTGAKYTKTRRPVVLEYQEECASKSEALKRECAIKKLTRDKKRALIMQFQASL